MLSRFHTTYKPTTTSHTTCQLIGICLFFAKHVLLRFSYGKSRWQPLQAAFKSQEERMQGRRVAMLPLVWMLNWQQFHQSSFT